MNKKGEELFLYILDKYHKPIINYIWRYLGSKDDAEDAAQVVFTKLYFRLEKFDSEKAITSYLYKSATNAARNIFRRKKLARIFTFAILRNEESDYPDSMVENIPQPSSSNDGKTDAGRQQILQHTISRLPHYQKAALELFYYEEKSYQEIAEILGKSVSSVESLLVRARQKLAETLKEQDLL